jgi:fatty-acid desaturase
MISCFAYQGGPLWWSSRHRAHHKFCDTTARDPHSPALIGIVNAFSFFLSGRSPDDMRSVQAVDEEFVPPHIDTPVMRVIDSLSFIFPLLEFYVALTVFGPAGLWVSFSSSWVGQVSVLWFNVRNHPIGGAAAKRDAPPPEHHSHRRTSTTNVNCDAIDRPKTVDTWPLYIFLDFIAAIISPAVGEDDHDHHHSHPALAVRPGFDAPHYFVSAMAALGLVWNVQRQGAPRVNSSRISLASLFYPNSLPAAKTALADAQGGAKDK